MRLLLISIGRGRTPWADSAAALYMERISRHLPTEEKTLKPAGYGADIERARRDEARRTMACLRPDDRVVVLDERGDGLGTEGFRKLVEGAMVGGCRRMVFCLGGPHGHHETTRARAGTLLSLSPLVLNHQVARVVLLEQVYRALTLIRGEPYHH